jgi:hypothetical protein
MDKLITNTNNNTNNESVKEIITKIKLLLNAVDKTIHNRIIYHGVTYTTFTSLHVQYRDVLNMMDIFVWLNSGFFDKYSRIRITASYPPFRWENSIIIKLLAPHQHEEKLIVSSLCMIDTDIPLEVRSLLLDNSIIKPELEMIIYSKFYHKIYSINMINFVDDLNAFHKTNHNYDEIVSNCFETQPIEFQIWIPIKLKINLDSNQIKNQND